MSAVVGAGVIEIAWTALMLAHGDDRSYRMKMATIEAIPYSLPTVRPSQARDGDDHRAHLGAGAGSRRRRP
jgi:hypothetical protein